MRTLRVLVMVKVSGPVVISVLQGKAGALS